MIRVATERKKERSRYILSCYNNLFLFLHFTDFKSLLFLLFFFQFLPVMLVLLTYGIRNHEIKISMLLSVVATILSLSREIAVALPLSDAPLIQRRRYCPPTRPLTLR